MISKSKTTVIKRLSIYILAVVLCFPALTTAVYAGPADPTPDTGGSAVSSQDDSADSGNGQGPASDDATQSTEDTGSDKASGTTSDSSADDSKNDGVIAASDGSDSTDVTVLPVDDVVTTVPDDSDDTGDVPPTITGGGITTPDESDDIDTSTPAATGGAIIAPVMPLPKPEEEEEEEEEEPSEVEAEEANAVLTQIVFNLIGPDINENQSGFEILLENSVDGVAYSMFLRGGRTNVKLRDGSYSVIAGGISPMNYGITDISDRVFTIEDGQSDIVSISVHYGEGGKKGFYRAYSKIFFVVDTAAVRLSEPLELELTDEDPMMEQTVPEDSPVILDEPDDTTGSTDDDSISDDDPLALTNGNMSGGIPDIIDQESPPGQDPPADTTNSLDSNEQRLSDLPGHSENSDVVQSGVVLYQGQDTSSSASVVIDSSKLSATSTGRTEKTIQDVYKELITNDLK